jgi:uncharacterized OsmC-like protein
VQQRIDKGRAMRLRDEREAHAQRLLRSAERYCVVVDMLRTGVPV